MKYHPKKIALFQEQLEKKILFKLCKKGYHANSIITQRETLLLMNSLCDRGVFSEQLFNQIWEHHFLPDKEHTAGLRESKVVSASPTIKQVGEALKNTQIVLINRLITMRNEVFTLEERLNRTKKKMDLKSNAELTAEIDQQCRLIKQCEQDLEQLTRPFDLEFRSFVNSQLLEGIKKKGQNSKQIKNQVGEKGQLALEDNQASDKSKCSDLQESLNSQIPKQLNNNLSQEENEEREHRQKHYRAVVYIGFMLSFIQLLSIFAKCHFLDFLCIFLFTMNCLAEDYLLYDEQKSSNFSLATKLFLDVANNRLIYIEQGNKLELQSLMKPQNQNNKVFKHDFQNFIISGVYLLVFSFTIELLWLLFQGQSLLHSGPQDLANLNLNMPHHSNYNQATAYVSIVSLICKCIAMILLIRIQHVSPEMFINRQVIYLPLLHFINIRSVMDRQLMEEETRGIDII